MLVACRRVVVPQTSFDDDNDIHGLNRDRVSTKSQK